MSSDLSPSLKISKNLKREIKNGIDLILESPGKNLAKVEFYYWLDSLEETE